MKVNCTKCGTGPDKKDVSSTEAVEFAEKHGQDKHGQSTVGLNVTPSK